MAAAWIDTTDWESQLDASFGDVMDRVQKVSEQGRARRVGNTARGSRPRPYPNARPRSTNQRYRHWQAIDVKTPAEAFCMIATGAATAQAHRQAQKTTWPTEVEAAVSS